MMNCISRNIYMDILKRKHTHTRKQKNKTTRTTTTTRSNCMVSVYKIINNNSEKTVNMLLLVS